MSKYNIMIFDLDGTLSNSKEGITKSVQYALKSVGIRRGKFRFARTFHWASAY